MIVYWRMLWLPVQARHSFVCSCVCERAAAAHLSSKLFKWIRAHDQPPIRQQLNTYFNFNSFTLIAHRWRIYTCIARCSRCRTKTTHSACIYLFQSAMFSSGVCARVAAVLLLPLLSSSPFTHSFEHFFPEFARSLSLPLSLRVAVNEFVLPFSFKSRAYIRRTSHIQQHSTISRVRCDWRNFSFWFCAARFFLLHIFSCCLLLVCWFCGWKWFSTY